MAQAHIIGFVTADFKLQTSRRGNPFVRFSVAEQIGHRNPTKVQYIQVLAFDSDAERLIKTKVKKGSQIWASGILELEECRRQYSEVSDKRLKLLLDNWGFIPGKSGQSDTAGIRSSPYEANTADISQFPVIDGDRDELPD
jgi:single-stranded DNA-binding protein